MHRNFGSKVSPTTVIMSAFGPKRRSSSCLCRSLEREVSGSPFVFVSERGAPFANRGFQAMVERAGKAAGFAMKIHPHMLRHACGYKLANDGVDTRTIQGYLGHRSIQHTVRYTELSPTRFKSLFRD